MTHLCQHNAPLMTPLACTFMSFGPQESPFHSSLHISVRLSLSFVYIWDSSLTESLLDHSMQLGSWTSWLPLLIPTLYNCYAGGDLLKCPGIFTSLLKISPKIFPDTCSMWTIVPFPVTWFSAITSHFPTLLLGFCGG